MRWAAPALVRILFLLAVVMPLACGKPVPAPRAAPTKKTAPARSAAKPSQKKKPAAGTRTISIIKGKLKAHLFEQKITANRPLTGIVYASDGLRALGQKEIIMILALPGPSTYFAFPLRFFKSVHALAKAGKVVDVGGRSDMGLGGIPGAPKFRAVIYARPNVAQGDPLGENLVVAIPLTSSEFAAYEKYGAARVLGLLGQHYRYYPYPTWFDLERPEVAALDQFSGTVLDKVTTVRSSPTTLIRTAARLSLTVPPRISALIDKVPKKAPFVILTNPSPRADAQLVWRRGQKRLAAIGPHGSAKNRVAGAFLLIMPTKGKNRIAYLEDGFALELNAADHKRLLSAVKKGAGFSTRTGGVAASFSLQLSGK